MENYLSLIGTSMSRNHNDYYEPSEQINKIVDEVGDKVYK